MDPVDFEVEACDVVDDVDWDNDDYNVTDQQKWVDSVYRCYDYPPKDQNKKDVLKKYRFCFTPDTEEQREVKTAAAQEAVAFVMDEFDKEYDEVPLTETLRGAIYSQADRLFCCLRTFHPLTLHLKCREFKKYYHQAAVYNCPFAGQASRWREYHGLSYLVSGKTAEACSCKKPQQLGSLTTHLARFVSSFHFHAGVHRYLQYCEEHLPNLATKIVIRDGPSSCTISSVRSVENAMPSMFNSDSDNSSLDDSSIPTVCHVEKITNADGSNFYTPVSGAVVNIKKKNDANATVHADFDRVMNNKSEEGSVEEETKGDAKPAAVENPTETAVVSSSSAAGVRNTNDATPSSKVAQKNDTNHGHGQCRFSNSNRWNNYGRYSYGRGNGRYNSYYRNWNYKGDDYSRYGPSSGGYNNRHADNHGDRNQYSFYQYSGNPRNYNANYNNGDHQGVDTDYRRNGNSKDMQYQQNRRDIRAAHRKEMEEACAVGDHPEIKEVIDVDMDNSGSTIKTSPSIAGKRSYAESKEGDNEILLNSKKDLEEAIAKAMEKIAKPEPVPVVQPATSNDQLITSLLSLVDTMSKSHGHHAKGYANHTKHMYKKQKQKRQNQRANIQGSTTTFNNEPLYMLTEACDELRVASNGGKFRIVMINVGEGVEKLPVPVWSDDDRTQKQLKNQGKANQRSRNTLYKLAQRMNEDEGQGNAANSSSNNRSNNNSSCSYAVTKKSYNIAFKSLKHMICYSTNT